MKKLLIGLSVVMMMSGLVPVPLQAQDGVLAKADLVIPSEEKAPLQVVKFAEKGEVYLKIQDKAGKELWKSESLGSEDRKFWLGKDAKQLAMADVNGDKVPEILAAAFIGPKSTGFYIFQVDVKTKKAAPIMSGETKEDSREMIVADIEAQDGSNIQVAADGKVVVAGFVYAEDKAPEAAQYTFALKEGLFKLEKTEKIPEPKEEAPPKK